MGNLGSKKEQDISQLSPNGLYTHCDWDVRAVKKLIGERKLAPISLGRVETPDVGFEECPICFLYYAGGLNRSRCCKKGVCTECYLQVKRPHQSSSCPFCNRDQYSIVFTGPLSRAEIDKEHQEQQKVQQLKVQMRNDEIERDKAREKERSLRQFPSSPPAGAGTSSGPGSPASSASSSSLPSNFVYSPTQQRANTPKSFVDSEGASTPIASSSDSAFSQSAADQDLEEVMLREAIRLSLLDPPSPAANNSHPRTEEHAAPPPPPAPLSPRNQSQDSIASEEGASSSAAGQDNEEEIQGEDEGEREHAGMHTIDLDRSSSSSGGGESEGEGELKHDDNRREDSTGVQFESKEEEEEEEEDIEKEEKEEKEKDEEESLL